MSIDYYAPQAVRSRAEKAVATATRRHAEQEETVHYARRGLELANMIGNRERVLNAKATLDAQCTELEIRARVKSLATAALQRLPEGESATPQSFTNTTQKEKPMTTTKQEAIDAAVHAVLESSMTAQEVEASATMTTEQRAKFLALRNSKRHQARGAK